jgi:hypothetical protein
MRTNTVEITIEPTIAGTKSKIFWTSKKLNLENAYNMTTAEIATYIKQNGPGFYDLQTDKNPLGKWVCVGAKLKTSTNEGHWGELPRHDSYEFIVLATYDDGIEYKSAFGGGQSFHKKLSQETLNRVLPQVGQHYLVARERLGTTSSYRWLEHTMDVSDTNIRERASGWRDGSFEDIGENKQKEPARKTKMALIMF